MVMATVTVMVMNSEAITQMCWGARATFQGGHVGQAGHLLQGVLVLVLVVVVAGLVTLLGAVASHGVLRVVGAHAGVQAREGWLLTHVCGRVEGGAAVVDG